MIHHRRHHAQTPRVGVSSECLDHFWRVQVGHFWRAPKAPGRWEPALSPVGRSRGYTTVGRFLRKPKRFLESTVSPRLRLKSSPNATLFVLAERAVARFKNGDLEPTDVGEPRQFDL